MRLRTHFLLFFTLLFGFGTLSGFGQKVELDLEMAQNTNWEVALSKKTSDLKVGDEFIMTFKGHIHKEFWHIYSATPPPGNMGYQPTTVYLDEKQDIELVGPTRDGQKPIAQYDEVFSDTVKYFDEHDVQFHQTFKVTGENPSLEGEFFYQICIDEAHGGKCTPVSLPMTFSFTAQPAATGSTDTKGSDDGDKGTDDASSESEGTAEVDSSGNDSADAGTPIVSVENTDEGDNAGSSSTDKPKKKKGETSLLFLFFQAFLFGFAAVLTPCVFPMIPLTVTFFTKQSKNRAKGISNALLYGFFIMFIYTVLGLSVSVAFGPDFMYQFSINPWVNLGFFVLLFVFALSFLGMFEITLPSSFVNKIDSQSDRGGMIGIFFMALTLAVVSFSCTGPLVGTALISAFSGNFMGPVVSMLGFSFALSIPFMIFALFPGMMNTLPKSGGWLNSVKVVLGFAELALGLKFLSQADLYQKWHILDREIFIGAWIVLFAVMGIYLLGFLRLPHDSKVDKISVPRLMLGMFSLWFVLYLTPGLWGGNLKFISGILPPHNAEVGVKILGEKEMNEGLFNNNVCTKSDRKYYDIFEDKEHHGFCTFYDLEQGIEFAKKNNMPLFVDFTGHTCANCRLMENNVWIRPSVSKILKDKYVMVSLYTDERGFLDKPIKIGDRTYKRIGKANLGYQKENYITFAQPYYVLMDPFKEADGADASNLADPRAYDDDVEEYVKFLQDGVAEFERRHK